MACRLMSAPVCLIENDENGQLRVGKEAKNYGIRYVPNKTSETFAKTNKKIH